MSIRLDALEEDKIGLFQRWRNDPRIYDWCRQNKLITRRDQIEWYKSQNDDPSIRMFVIKEGEKEVGVCGLTSIDLINRRAEFSLYISPTDQGKGIGRKALKSLFYHGFNGLNLHVIWGESFEGNPARKMFRELGMVEEGIRRDFYYKNGKYINAVLYSITRDEFHAGL
jgi:RimJ/RimL family protein N-acetyltransferase